MSKSNTGKGGNNRRGKGGKANHHAPPTKKTQGQCAELGNHVFEYGTPGAADKARTSWDALVVHVAAKHGQDIGSELRNRKTLDIPKPEYSAEVLEVNVWQRKESRITQP